MPDRSSPVLGSFGSSVNKSYRRCRDGAEAPRNSLDYSSMNSRWIAAGYEDVPFGFEVPSFKSRSKSTGISSSFGRQPSVVARLMGLDMFPSETIDSQPESFRKADCSEGLKGGLHENRFQDQATCSRNSARELLDAVQFLQSNKESFLDLLQQKGRSEKPRMEKVPEAFPARIVILKPGPRSSLKLSSLEDEIENPPEKILHVVTQTRQATSAKDFLKEQLHTGSSNAKEIAQAIARKARDEVPTLESSPSSRMKHPETTTTLSGVQEPRASSLPNSPKSTSAEVHVEKCKYRLTRSRSEKLPDQKHERNFSRTVEGKSKPSRGGVKFHKLQKFHNLDILDYKERQAERAARALDFNSVCSSRSLVTTYKDVRKADMVYTWKVIFAVLSHSSNGFSWMRNSMLSTRIFQRLELDYQTTGGSSTHRRLLFDVVAEILARKHQYSWNSSILFRQRLMREVWGELSRSAGVERDSSQKILTSQALWPGADEELHKLGTHLSRDIFITLIDEAAYELLKQTHQHS